MRRSGTRMLVGSLALLWLVTALPNGGILVGWGQERLFTVQVASLESAEEADKVVGQLKSRGLPAYRQPAVLPEVGQRQRVRFGRFTTAALARTAAEQARQAGWITEYIVAREEPGATLPSSRVGGTPPEKAEAVSAVPRQVETTVKEATAEQVVPPRVEIIDPDWEMLPASTLPNEGWQVVWFVDPLTGWVGGKRGALRRTTDGGQTWKRLPLGRALTVRSLFFLDWRHGWLMGEEPGGGTLLLATEDGGEQWSERSLTVGPPFRTFCFLDTRRGVALRGEGALWRTIDGGRQWAEVKGDTGSFATTRVEELQCQPRSPFGKGSPGAWGISGTGPGGESQLWETRDGAESWQRVALPTRKEAGPIRLRNLRVSANGLVQLEIGSGSAPNWETILSVPAVTPSHLESHPEEANRRWQLVGSSPPGTSLGAAFPEISAGWRLVRATDEWPQRLWMTTDQGAHWQESLRLGRTSPLLLWFASPRHGWLISEEGWMLTYRASPPTHSTALRASLPTPTPVRPE